MSKRSSKFTIKHLFFALSLLCIVLIIATWESRDDISTFEKTFAYTIVPVNNGVNVMGDWLNSRVEFVQNISDYEALNDALTQENEQLKYENKILEQSQIELERLRTLYDLDQRYADFPKTGAQVIGKDPGNWYEIFIINKGTEDDLSVNMVVLAGAGLVGHIIEVGPNYAKVQSIINDNHHVSAKSLRTGDLAVISGDITLIDEEAYCYVDKISDDANIIVGDDLVTSHLSDIYPEGILIGKIVEMTDNEHKMTKTGIIKPVVDFMHLEEVLVIKQVFDDEVEE